MARSVLQDLAGNETLGQVDELLRLVKAAGREVVDDVRWGEDAAELTPKAAVPEGLDVEAGWAGADRSRACWRCTFLLPSVSVDEVAAYLGSSSWRADPANWPFLQGPGRTAAVSLVARLEGGEGACGKVLYSEHRHAAAERSFSLLRVVRRTTTARGRRLVVEAPVTHPARPDHCPERADGRGKARSMEAWAPLVAYTLEAQRSGVLVRGHLLDSWPAQPGRDEAKVVLRSLSALVADSVAFLTTQAGKDLLAQLRERLAGGPPATEARLEGVAVPPEMESFLQECIHESRKADPIKIYSVPAEGDSVQDDGCEEDRPEWVEEAVEKHGAESALDNWDRSWSGADGPPALGEDLDYMDEGVEDEDTAGPSGLRRSGHRSPAERRDVSEKRPAQAPMLPNMAKSRVESIKEKYGRAGGSSSKGAGTHSAPGQGVGEALGNVGHIMAEGMEKLLGREEKLQTIQGKTAAMEDDASNFADLAEQLRAKMENRRWWNPF